jgi:hypothetical protein
MYWPYFPASVVVDPVIFLFLVLLLPVFLRFAAPFIAFVCLHSLGARYSFRGMLY